MNKKLIEGKWSRNHGILSVIFENPQTHKPNHFTLPKDLGLGRNIPLEDSRDVISLFGLVIWVKVHITYHLGYQFTSTLENQEQVEVYVIGNPPSN